MQREHALFWGNHGKRSLNFLTYKKLALDQFCLSCLLLQARRVGAVFAEISFGQQNRICPLLRFGSGDDSRQSCNPTDKDAYNFPKVIRHLHCLPRSKQMTLLNTFRRSLAVAVVGCAVLHAAVAAAPPRTIRDIVTLLDQYQPDPQRAQTIQEALRQEPPADADRATLAKFYWERGRKAGEAGEIRQQVADLSKAAELESTGNLGRLYNELSFAQMGGSDLASALDSTRKAISYIPQNQSGLLIANYGRLAELLRQLGNQAESERAARDAESMFVLLHQVPNWAKFEHIWTTNYQNSRAGMLLAAGKAREAELAYTEALREIELYLPLNAKYLVRGDDNTAQEQLMSSRDAIELRLADALAQQGKLFDAEMHIRNALQRTLSRVGRYSIQTARAALQYTRLLLEQRRAVEAETMVRSAIDILERTGASPDALPVISARRLLAASFVSRQQWQKALEEYERMRAQVSSQYQDRLAGGDLNWALSLIHVGKPEAAIAMLDPLFAKAIQWTGEGSYQAAELRGYRGMAYARSGDKARALADLRKAVTQLLAAQKGAEYDPSPVRQRRLATIVNAYIGLLADIRGTALEASTGIDAAAEAFRLADVSRSQEVQRAVAAAAARNAADNPELAAIVRKTQDLRQEADSLHKILVNLMSAPPDKQLPGVISDMKKRLGDINREQNELNARIEKGFPAYAELVSPRPAGLDQARAALRPGEALLNIVSTEDHTYLWAVSKNGPVAFAVSPLASAEIVRLVASLRKSLDPGDVELDQIPPFDVEAAWQLYNGLLAPVAAGWQGTENLLVSAGGALSQLPFGLLATSRVSITPDKKLLFGHLAQVPWLIRQMAVTHLPSMNSLVVLRQQKAAAKERSPFFGLGDPDFGGKAALAARSRGKLLRNLTVDRASDSAPMKEAAPEWIDYSRIPPLPDTREEILSLAKALGADASRDVLLGPEASKEKLKNADLQHRQIVAFATHGLLPGDFPGVDEPALALANPGGGQHGLLTLSEILSLKLDADWVVLSACNTAAGDGSGADAISGLGRGFFYAGTRALLVTHWPVETTSARLLVTGVFKRYAADPNLSRAEALRQSMLALIDSPGYVDPGTGRAAFSYAHPMFWAPYALVGDGGAH